MSETGEQRQPETGDEMMPVTGLVPMIPVSDIERSVEFYRLLGFAVGNRVPNEGTMQWAWLYAPKAPNWRRGPNLMLTRGKCAAGGGVLFYLYASDLAALREELVTAGQKPGPITNPDYLPEGELAIEDPDGYCLMLAQSTPSTP